MDTTAKLLDDILNRRIIKGRVTSQGDLEQWTCLQKIIAIDKLIRAYAIAFKTYADEFQETQDSFIALLEDWDSFREEIRNDYGLLVDEWSEYKTSTTEDFNVYYNNLNSMVDELEALIEEVRTQYGTLPEDVTKINEYISNTEEIYRTSVNLIWGNDVRVTPQNKLYRNYHIRVFPTASTGNITGIRINQTQITGAMGSEGDEVEIVLTPNYLNIEQGIGDWFCEIKVWNKISHLVTTHMFGLVQTNGLTANTLGEFIINFISVNHENTSCQVICENLIMED